MRCPIFLFHGTLDSLIPVDSSERLAALFSAPHKVIPVEGAGHPDIPAFPIYHEQLDEMLR